jgi:glycosyltransferase involved in cell wall biosynthesis
LYEETNFEMVMDAKSLTVLNVGQNYHIKGGSDRYQFVLSDLLEAHGHRVVPFASVNAKNLETVWSSYFPSGANFDNPNLADISRYIYSKNAAQCMERLLGEAPISLAHLHVYYGKLTASILKPLQQAGVPVIQTLHDLKLVCPVHSLSSHGSLCQECEGKNFWKATMKRCNRGSLTRSFLSTVESYVSKFLGSVNRVDHFIAVSKFQRDKMIELGIPAPKVTMVYNFIDASEIQPSYRGGEYLLYFGRIERSKGIFTLVEAAAALTQTPLLIVGDGSASQELVAYVKERKLSHIYCLGFKQGKELSDLISHSICCIAPSVVYDNCPLSVLEAYAFGKPVIGSRIGGIPELITDGEDGFIVPPGDVSALRERLLWMQANKEKATKMGAKGRFKVESHFNADLHYKQIMDVYQQFL